MADNLRLRVRAPEALAARLPSPPHVRMGMPRIALTPLAPSGDWLLTTFAPIPGVVQWRQRRRRIAYAFFGALAVLAFGAVAVVRSDAAIVFVWLIGALSVMSIADASWRAGQDSPHLSEPLRRTRALMLAFQSLCLLGFSIGSLCLPLSRNFPIYTMRTEDAAPMLHGGDGLLVHSWSDPAHSARHGDVALIVLGDDFPVAERLIGLSGDTVEYGNGEIWVNGRVLTPPQMPIAFRPATPAFQVVVPKGQFLIWGTISGGYVPGREREEDVPPPPSPPYLLVAPDEIRGKVIAVYTPSAHRRWIQ